MKVKRVTPTLAHIEILGKRMTLTYSCRPTVKPAPNTVKYEGCLGGPPTRITEDEHQRGRRAAAKEMARARIR